MFLIHLWFSLFVLSGSSSSRGKGRYARRRYLPWILYDTSTSTNESHDPAALSPMRVHQLRLFTGGQVIARAAFAGLCAAFLTDMHFILRGYDFVPNCVFIRQSGLRIATYHVFCPESTKAPNHPLECRKCWSDLHTAMSNRDYPPTILTVA